MTGEYWPNGQHGIQPLTCGHSRVPRVMPYKAYSVSQNTILPEF